MASTPDSLGIAKDIVDPSHPWLSQKEELDTLTSKSAMAVLESLSAVDVKGTDAASFLHAQFTNDVVNLNVGTAQRNAWCTPKGRVITTMHILRFADDHFRVLMSASLLDAVVRRLKMFVLRAKVEVAPLDDYATLGLAATTTVDHDGLPTEEQHLTVQNDVVTVRLAGQPHRFYVVGPTASLRELWAQLSSAFTPVHEAAWQALDVSSGLPSVQVETSDEHTPQMLNLELLDFVSFDKGCYPGQEIVARTQYLGRIKRRTFRLAVDEAELVAPNTPVFVEGESQAAGTTLMAAPTPSGGQEVLAVLRADKTQLPLSIGRPDGPLASLLPLPYDVPADVDSSTA